MATSDPVRNDFLRWCVGQASTFFGAAPTSRYLAFFTDAPTAFGGGVEVSGDNYSRQSIIGKFGTPANGAVSNSQIIALPAATGDGHGEIDSVAIMDAPTGGNIIKIANVTPPKTIGSGDPASFAAGALTFRQP